MAASVSTENALEKSIISRNCMSVKVMGMPDLKLYIARIGLVLNCLGGGIDLAGFQLLRSVPIDRRIVQKLHSGTLK